MRSVKQIILSVLISVSFSLPLLAKKDDFKVVKPSSKKLVIDDMNREIPRNKLDERLDHSIHERYGDDYRRANVYDLYPMELPRNKTARLGHKGEVELMEYYIYARKNLEKVSKSQLLKAESCDFDMDGDTETAVIVWNTKRKEPYLAIFNKQSELYFKEFKADFIELVNHGKYPSGIFDDKKIRTLHSPTLRIIDFGEYNQILYYDKKEKSWEQEEVQE